VWLFVSAFDTDEQPRSVGVARAMTATGAFEAAPSPFATAEDVGAVALVAPSVVVTPDTIRAYVTAVFDDGIARIRLFEAER
jgi:hypothetical protein